ncbi:MAG: SAM-dependent methyltransferase, partial [Microbacterium sp.]|nr:SAM-dependent methyltransferase [Microbacterium sp.]
MTLHPDAARCTALRTDLDAAGYRADAVRELWGAMVDTAVGHGLIEPARRVLAGRTDALAVLAGLLFLGGPAPRESVDAALPSLGAAGLVELGLAHVDGDLVVPDALVRPQDI